MNSKVKKTKEQHSKDISTIKQTEELLTSNGTNLNRIFEISPGLICVANANEGFFTECNPAVTSILGWSVKEFTSKPFNEFIHPDDQQITVDTITEQLKGNQVANFENRYRCKDGSYKWLAWQATAVDKNGIVYAVATDITERKTTENELKDSEEKYKALFANIEDAVLISDPITYKILDANKATSKMYGYSKKELIGMSVLKLSAEVEESVSASETLTKDKKVNISYRLHKKKDGTIIVVDLNAYAITLGTKKANIMISRDVTERKRAEKALLLTQFSVDNSTDAVYWIRPDAKFVYVNNAAVEMLGYSKAELLSMTVHDIGPDFPKEVWPAHWAELKEKKSFIIQAIHQRKDRSTFPVEITLNFIKFGDQEINYAIAHDITERKQTHDKLTESENKFKTFFKNSPDLIGLIDNKGTVLDINHVAKGYNKADVLGTNITEYLTSEQTLEFKDACKKSINTGESYSYFPAITNPDGQTIYWHNRISAINKDVLETNFIVNFTDVTIQKLAEEKLIEINKNLAMLGQTVSSMNECVSISDRKHKIIFINTAFEETYGYKKEEIMGKSSRILRVEIKPELMSEIRKKTDLGGWKGELLNKKKDGTIFPVELSITPLRDVNGKVYAQIGISTDITNRKQAEEALKLTQISVDNSTDAVYWMDSDAKFIYVNNAAVKALGYSKEELLTMTVHDIGPEFPVEVWPAHWAEVKEKKSFVIHTTHQRKNESTFPVEITVNFIQFGGREINCAIAKDITERVKAEREIRKLSTAIKQSPVSIMITDTDGIIEYVNPTFEKLTGYTAEEAIGNNPNILKSGVTSDSEYRKLWETITKGEIWVGEFLNMKKNGELYFESATISPITDNNNKITHFLAIKEDITKKKEMINDLMEREEKYRTLTYNLNVGVYRSTPGKNGMVIEANPAFLKMFEFRGKDELERWKIVDLYHDPTDRKNLEEKLASKGFIINEEVQLRKKDGTIFNASLSTTVAKDESGKIIHYDGIIEDVTEEHKTREAILAYQLNLKSLTNELLVTEEANKRHLAMILHDKLLQSLVLANFKTGELNKRTTDSKHKKVLAEISSFIEDAINESRNITYELNPPVLYEMGLIPSISWKLEEIEKNNKIKTSLTDQSTSYELDEKEQIILYRTINELLQNVIKHSKAENVDVSFRQFTNDYRITVSDDGIGFDLEAMKDKAVSQKKFGLFSLMERIRFVGGEVLINTEPNKGTKVIINLPIKINKY